MNVNEIRSVLLSETFIEENAFNILHQISCYVNNPETEEIGREFVLRALEKRECFRGFWEVLDSMTRQVGLFPYLEPNDLSFRDLIAYEFHRPPSMEETFVFHRAQSEIYHRLISGENVILSAPTSFGKSKIIDAVIATDRFRNIAVIVPTIALIDETRIRLSTFSEKFKIITQLSQRPGDKNIFIFTPERINAYESLPSIDFFVIDEFYKIGALDEDETRTVSLNQAFYKLFKGGGQFYLLGPNIKQIPEGLENNFRCFFYSTTFSTVVSELIPIYEIGDELQQLVVLAKGIEDQTLIFCRSPKRVNEVAKLLVDHHVCEMQDDLNEAANWISEHYHKDWIFPIALSNRIGMHHGRLPRSLTQYVVRCFNEGRLKFLICTSTLIEGVNTNAKNMIILDNVIGRQKYDFFTFNNIKGRSGRMFHHFVGKVYVFHQPPQDELPFVDFPLFTQGDSTPESLLIQIDEEDLNEKSKKRLANIFKQSILPLELIKQNSGIDPESQVKMANFLEGIDPEKAKLLVWNQIPSWEKLNFVCHLIWDYLWGRSGKSGVFSAEQLAFKTFSLMQKSSIRIRMEAELKPGQYAAQTVDEAMERVFEFDRNWAGFELPRLLMAVSRIQNFVFQKRFGFSGDYSFFASQLECLFRNPVALALDEYGLPMQISEKIERIVSFSDDLEEVIAKIKRIPDKELGLLAFELSIFKYVIKYL